MTTVNTLSLHGENWSADPLGNSAGITTDGVQQNRGYNAQNQINYVNIGNVTAYQSYDQNGNLTLDDQGHTLIYDAWNRLVQVMNGTRVLASYSYDALSRRIQETHGGTTTDLYFSAKGQVLEEQQGGQTTRRRQTYARLTRKRTGAGWALRRGWPTTRRRCWSRISVRPRRRIRNCPCPLVDRYLSPWVVGPGSTPTHAAFRTGRAHPQPVGARVVGVLNLELAVAGISQLDDVYWLESFAQHIGTLYHRARQQDILVMCQGYQGLFDRIPETLKEFFLVDEVVVFKTLYHAKPDSVSLECVGAFPLANKLLDGASGLYGFAKKQFGERRIPPLYFSANRAWAYDQPDDSPPKAGQEDWAIAIECRQCPHRQDSAPTPWVPESRSRRRPDAQTRLP